MIQMRAAGYQGAASVHTRAMQVLVDRLGQQGFAPTLTADVTRAGRNATDLFSMTEDGENEVMHFAASYLAGRVPALAVFDLPFRYSGRAGLLAALDGALGQALQADIARQTGFACLGFWDNGARHMTNLFRPLRGPADCTGLSIRTMQSALHQATFAALGMRPVYIDVKDYPAAVRDGTVDAQENPHTNTLNFGIPAHHPHMTITGHFQGVSLFLIRRRWLDGLDAPARDTVLLAAAEATAAQRAYAAAEDESALAAIRAAGVRVEPDWDRAAFVEATAGVRRDAEAAIDAGVLRLLPES